MGISSDEDQIDLKRERSLKKFISGLSSLSSSFVLMLVLECIFAIIVLPTLIFIGLWSNVIDIMLVLGQMSTFIPFMSMSLLMLLPIITMFTLISPAKDLPQIKSSKVKRSAILLLILTFVHNVIFFIFIFIAGKYGLSGISGLFMSLVAFCNILGALMVYYAIMFPVQDLLDERMRRKSNRVLVLFLLAPIIFAFDGAFMISKLLFPAPQFTIVRGIFYILMFVLMIWPYITSIRIYSWSIKTLRGKIVSFKPKKEQKEWQVKTNKFLWKNQSKPRNLMIGVLAVSIIFSLLNGFIGELDPIEINWDFLEYDQTPYERFEEDGVIVLDTNSGYLGEGESIQEVIDVGYIFYFVDVYITWDDEGNFVRWVNTPDQFELTVELFDGEELVASDTDLNQDEWLEVFINIELDPKFVSTMVITLKLVNAGDYEKRFGPGLFETNTDDGNDWTMDLWYGYIDET